MFWCSAEISGLWLWQPLAAVPFPFAARVEELTRDHLRTLVGMSQGLQGPPYDLHPDDRPPLSARDVQELESKMADLLRQKEELIKQLQGQMAAGATASPGTQGPGLARQFSTPAEP